MQKYKIDDVDGPRLTGLGVLFTMEYLISSQKIVILIHSEYHYEKYSLFLLDSMN